MAVDRGSLQYTIQVEDNFSTSLKSFRTQLEQTKAELSGIGGSAAGFRELRAEIEATTRAAQRRSSTAASASAEERAAAREQVQSLRELQAGLKQQAANEKIRASLAKEVRANQAASAKEAQAAAAAQVKASAAAAAAAQKASQENRRLVAGLFQTESAANRVAFTFRRLFGILAAFTIARQAVAAFTGLISSAVDFNRTVEDSRIGLGSLFTALGDVTDASGKLVEGPAAFAESIKIADDQMRKLRLDSLRTTATFSQLIETFQIAIAPGLGAGLKLDEIRQLAVKVSQAAAAIGVPQNQLAEEIRALLIPGAATSRTSRIFTALSIKPDELKRAKEAGKIFEFLQPKLKAFDIAAAETQKTYSGLVARINDAVGLAAGNASILFFDDLKGLLKDVGDSFVIIKRDAKGAIDSIEPNPAAVATLGILFDGLKGAIDTIRSGMKSLDLGQIQSSVALIADLFKGAGQVVVGFVQGLVGGLADAGVLARSIFGSFDSPALKDAVSSITRIGTLLIGASLAMSTILGVVKLLFSPLSLIVGLSAKFLGFVQVTASIIGLLPAQIFTLVAPVALIGEGFRRWASDLLGVNLGLHDTLALLNRAVESQFEKLFSDNGQLLKVKTQIKEIEGIMGRLREQIAQGPSNLEAFFGAGSAVKAEEYLLELQKQLVQLKLQEGELTKTNTQQQEDGAKRDAALINEMRDRLEKVGQVFNANDPFSFLRAEIPEIKSLLNGLIGPDTIDTEGTLAKLNDMFNKIQAGLGDVQSKAAAANEELVVNSFGSIIQRSQNFIDNLTSAVTGFANFASSAIVDAFDPTQDVDIKERFARFLQDLAKQILNMILTLLIATAIAKAFGVPLASSKPEPIPTLPFAEGGEVPKDAARPAVPRPANIPSSDTVPAWLTPGEFVQTAKTVARYGLDFMEALRQGALDPSAVRGLMDGVGIARGARSSSVRTSRGFQTGGLVAASQQAEVSANKAAETDSKPPIALIAGNNVAMERLLSGGKKAMLDFLRQNNYLPTTQRR